MSDPIPPVDRSQQQLTDGSPVPVDRSHTGLRENGQQRGYVVLTAAERAKGFVKPVRRSYVHRTCGGQTSMGNALAETYARDPSFYSGTFCVGCGSHFPLDQFNWDPDGEPMDPDLQADWHEAMAQREAAVANARASELEARERAELSRLKAKYEPECSR